MEKFVGPDEGAFAARRVVAPYTLRAATWGGPYGYYGTLHAVGADVLIRPAFYLEIQPVVLQLVDQIPQQVHVIGGDDISRNGRPP